MSPLAPLLALAASLAAAAPAPSVLILSIDDLRADRVTETLMPNLSRLATESLLFTQAITPATWTLPAHSSLLTGLYPSRHGGGGTPLEPRAMGDRIPTLAELLGARGWSASSLTNAPFFHPSLGVVRGFKPRLNLPMLHDPLDEAMAWFEVLPQPALLFLHTYQQHHFAVLPVPAPGGDPCPPTPAMIRDDKPLEGCANVRAAYDRVARCTDRALGRFFEQLKAKGRWDSLLLVVTSDHGESLCDGNGGGRLGHRLAPYEEQLRVPLIVKFPNDGRAGGRVEHPVSLVDVAPTILDALGVPLPPSLDGRSLIGGEAARPLFVDAEDGFAVRHEGWKLFSTDGQSDKVFDLNADPLELLAAERAEREPGLRALLRQHVARSAGWHVALRGPPGTRFEVTAVSTEPFTLARSVFADPLDRFTLSKDKRTARASFVIGPDDDEDWLLLSSSGGSAPGLSLTRDGKAFTLNSSTGTRITREPEFWPGPIPVAGRPAPPVPVEALRAAGYFP